MLPLLVSLTLAADPAYPPLPPTTADADQLGRGVQRTLGLLASSTKEKPNTVRILFYGQSITEQDWWKQVVADLKRRFPTAVIDAQNRAIGGFSSQRLVLTAEHDLYPFYPDLLIFHVYGAHDKYEEIIRNVRTRTAAEVLMQTDHRAKKPPAEIDEKQDKAAWWDQFMNTKFLPATAKKYDCGLVDVRGRWDDYLVAYKLEPKALLKDDIHLNAHGNFVMGSVVSRYLVRRPELKEDQRLVFEDRVGGGVQRHGNTLLTLFKGCRVDVVCDPWTGRTDPPKLTARFDADKPSDLDECRWISRPAPGPWSKLFLMRIGHDKALVPETWTLTVTRVEDGGKKWAFKVAGSVTGEDGDGVSDKPFVSKSGRIKIDPASWFPNGGPAVGYRVTWNVNRSAVDEVPASGVQTIAHGLDATDGHMLALESDKAAIDRVRAIRIYSPPFPKKLPKPKE